MDAYYMDAHYSVLWTHNLFNHFSVIENLDDV